MKSNGNGTIVISKGILALITFLFMIVGSVASVVAMHITVKSDVDHIKTILPDHEERIRMCEYELAQAHTNLEVIKEDLVEIKSDIKQILLRGKS